MSYIPQPVRMLHKEQREFLHLTLPISLSLLLKGDDKSTVSLSEMESAVNRSLSLSETFICMKRKVVPVHAMKAHRRRRGTAPLTLKLSTKCG